MLLEIKEEEIFALKWLLLKGMEQTKSDNKYELFERLYDNLAGVDQLFDTQTAEGGQADLLVSVILSDYENLLIDIMSKRKCSIGSLGNYYELHLEVKKINELYSKLQEYFTVSKNSA